MRACGWGAPVSQHKMESMLLQPVVVEKEERGEGPGRLGSSAGDEVGRHPHIPVRSIHQEAVEGGGGEESITRECKG
uniref:Uncharacterized protein n=1 Tax=Knipowitschia caucasica TaxID=637954 RepID=A0AAV2LRQ8_KNICA